MICYRSNGKGLVWIHPQKNRLRIYLRKGAYNDNKGKLKLEGWGGYPEITFTEEELDIFYIRNLITQVD